MNLAQLLSGAGTVGTSWRAAEDAQRQSRQLQLQTDELNRLDRLRQEMLGAPMPQGGVPQFNLGADDGVLPVRFIEPPAPPAAPAAPAPVAVSVQPPPALPFGQDVPNPVGNERANRSANELIRMREMRIKDIESGLERLMAGGGSPRMIENQKQLLAREQGLLEDARRGANLTSPTVPFGLEGRNAPAPQTDYSGKFATLEQKYGLPAGLLNAVMMVESEGKPGQVSKKGAKGYFQFMDATAKQYGVRVNDLDSEAEGAARMLSDLLKMTGGDLNKALAGYNWGIGNVQRKGMDKMPAETQAYIPKVMGFMQPNAATQVAQAPTTSAAPAGVTLPGQTAPVAQAAPAAAVEGPVRVDVSGTSDYYLARPRAITADMQRAMQQREEIARLAGMYQRAGLGAQFMQTRVKLMEVDNNMTYLQGMQGLQEFTLANDPRRLAAVWSQYAGVPVGIQFRTDGKFDIMVNGKRAKEGVTRDEAIDAARSGFDAVFRQQKSTASAAYNMETFKAGLEVQKENAKQLSQMIREIAVERVKGTNAQALEWAKANYGWDIKPTGSGDGTVIIRAPGAQPYIFNPSGRTVEIDGVKITSNAAYPIAGLPSYGGVKTR
jgi:hypothetical protein